MGSQNRNGETIEGSKPEQQSGRVPVNSQYYLSNKQSEQQAGKKKFALDPLPPKPESKPPQTEDL